MIINIFLAITKLIITVNHTFIYQYYCYRIIC